VNLQPPEFLAVFCGVGGYKIVQKILKRLLFFYFVFFTGNFCIASTLPNGYTQLEYIESTGTQYIDTEIILSDYTNPKIVFTGKLASKTDNGNFMLGTYNNDPQHIFFINNSRISYDYDNFGPQKRFDFSDQDYILDKHTYYCKYTQNGSDKKFSLGIDSENYTQEDTYTDLPTVYSLYLFGRNTAGTLQLSKTVIYGFKFYDGSTLVYNFIPAKRDNDGMVGMYDLVNNKFYINSGTGTFIAGPAVCAATVAILGAQFCLTEIQPSGSYLTARYNNNKYYLNLSVENDALNPKTITSESNNVLRIKVGNTTYNAHDVSVSE